MQQYIKTLLFLGCINAALSIILGAFGAHALRMKISEEMMNVYQTGVQYHFYHAIGLCIVGVAGIYLPKTKLTRTAGWIMLLGIVLFSGSLYTLSISGIKFFGVIVPFGGIAFIVSWIILAIAVIRK